MFSPLFLCKICVAKGIPFKTLFPAWFCIKMSLKVGFAFLRCRRTVTPPLATYYLIRQGTLSSYNLSTKISYMVNIRMHCRSAAHNSWYRSSSNIPSSMAFLIRSGRYIQWICRMASASPSLALLSRSSKFITLPLHFFSQFCDNVEIDGFRLLFRHSKFLSDLLEGKFPKSLANRIFLCFSLSPYNAWNNPLLSNVVINSSKRSQSITINADCSTW